MVMIVDKIVPPLNEAAVLKFKVHRSPKVGHSVFGRLEPVGVISSDGRSVTWFETDHGVPVEEAFLSVVGIAEREQMATILIVDPEGLFPLEKQSRQ